MKTNQNNIEIKKMKSLLKKQFQPYLTNKNYSFK